MTGVISRSEARALRRAWVEYCRNHHVYDVYVDGVVVCSAPTIAEACDLAREYLRDTL